MQIRLSSLLVLAFVLFLSGCSGVRYVYSQLDWIVPWYARDYVRLDASQRALLKTRLDERLAWHCESEIPTYTAFLRALEGELGQPQLRVETLEHYVGQATVFWDDLIVALVPDIADVLAELNDAQIAALALNLNERNEDTRADFLEPSEAQRHENRVERMEKRLQRWFGRLTAEQKDGLIAWSHALQPATEEWFENRLAWQARLLDTLAVRDDRSQFDDRVAALMKNPDAGWGDSYRARVNANRDLTLALIADTYDQATPAQRARVANELSSLARQLDRLACGPSSPVQVSRMSPAR